MLTGFMRNLLAIAYKMRLRGLVYQHLSREIYLEGYVNRTFLHNRSERERERERERAKYFGMRVRK